MNRFVLITGAGGLMGRHIVSALLQQTDRPLLLWLHARDASEFAAKRAALTEAFNGNQRLAWAWGDLQQEHPFAGVPAAAVSHIVHCAAATRFNLDADTADAVNVRGSRKLYAFAQQCPDLQRLVLLSTVYVSGLGAGPVSERVLWSRPDFANHYERSKWEAEVALAGDYPALPWTIVRMPTAVADNVAGHISQYNAFHNTLKLCYYGLLSLLPGDPGTPVHLTTAQSVARTLVTLMMRGTAPSVVNVCAESLSLQAMLDTAFDVFNGDAEFRARGVRKPVFCDQQAFATLVAGASAFSGSVVGESLHSIAPFAPQLFVHKQVLCASGRRHACAVERVTATQLVRRSCENLLASRWGRSRP